jgi:PIN domain nuclease of toxin-antitoxin system
VIVLDTHVIAWFVQGNDRLGVKAQKLVQEVIAQGEAVISTITFWEIAMLSRRGKLNLRRPVRDWIAAFYEKSGILVTEISREIAVAAGELGDDIHGDPSDRLIIATALYHDCSLLTADRAILGYGTAGHVQTIDASL